MSTRYPMCECGHSSLAHSFTTWCRMLLCPCNQFVLKATLVKSPAPVVSASAPPLDALETLAREVLGKIHPKLGMTLRRTNGDVVVTAHVGGQMLTSQRRAEVEKVSGTGRTLAEALRALLADIEGGETHGQSERH